ncbi:hypothetical protein ACSVBT_11365 [Afipia sp. TerB]
MPTVLFEACTAGDAGPQGQGGRFFSAAWEPLCSYLSGKHIVRPDSDIAARAIRFHRRTQDGHSLRQATLAHPELREDNAPRLLTVSRNVRKRTLKYREPF